VREVDAQLVAQPAVADRPEGDRQLDREVEEEGRGEHPRAVVVGGEEGELPRVVELDVEDARYELEQRGADQQREAQTLEAVGERADRRPLEELGDDRPELGEEDRRRCDADRHVQALAGGVEPRGARRPPEEVEVQGARCSA